MKMQSSSAAEARRQNDANNRTNCEFKVEMHQYANWPINGALQSAN